MAGRHAEPRRVWTVSQAKARLSEVLRRAEEEGPQHIGVRRPFVVVPAGDWYAKTPPRRPMGRGWSTTCPAARRSTSPRTEKSRREIPFAAGTAE